MIGGITLTSPNERKYKSLLIKIRKIKDQEHKLITQRIGMEVEARYLLPLCVACEGTGKVIYGHDDYNGGDSFGMCKDCYGRGWTYF